jgi:hypothetical protein
MIINWLRIQDDFNCMNNKQSFDLMYLAASVYSATRKPITVKRLDSASEEL